MSSKNIRSIKTDQIKISSSEDDNNSSNSSSSDSSDHQNLHQPDDNIFNSNRIDDEEDGEGESLEDFDPIIDHDLIRDVESDHRFGGSHWLPLLFALLPSLGSIFHGEPESWTNGLIILLVAFFLYKISKEPWKLYASARTNRILTYARDQSRLRRRGTSDQKRTSTQVIYPLNDHSDYTTELKRTELGLLIFAILSPSIGVGLLLYLQTRLNLRSEYLNSNSTTLFLLSSLVRPCSHLNQLLSQRAKYLQDQLKFPVQLAEEINESIDQLVQRIRYLQDSTVDQEDLKAFKLKCFDGPLNEIGKKLSKLQKAEELTEVRSKSKLKEIEEDVNRLVEKLQRTEKTLEGMRIDQEILRQSPVNMISSLLLQLLRNNQIHDARQFRPALMVDEDNNPGQVYSKLGFGVEEIKSGTVGDHQETGKDQTQEQRDHPRKTRFKQMHPSQQEQEQNHQRSERLNGGGDGTGSGQRPRIPSDDRSTTRKSSNILQRLIQMIFSPIAIVLTTWMRMGGRVVWLVMSPMWVFGLMLKSLKGSVMSLHNRISEDTKDRYKILSERNYRDDRSSLRGHRLRPIRAVGGGRGGGLVDHEIIDHNGFINDDRDGYYQDQPHHSDHEFKHGGIRSNFYGHNNNNSNNEYWNPNPVNINGNRDFHHYRHQHGGERYSEN